MKGSLILGLLLLGPLLGGCAGSVELDVRKRFEQAEAAFREAETEADFLAVAARYQALVDEGVESGAVYFNLGNAYVRAGESGRAIAAYRKAQVYRPRDPYLEANLKVALGSSRPQERRLLDYVFFWRSVLSPHEKWTVTFTLLTIFLLVTILMKIRPSVGGLRWAAVVLLVITGLFGAALGLDYYEQEVRVAGVVVEGGVIARKGDGETFEPALTEPLGEGVEFVVLEDRGDWIHVSFTGGVSGWIPRTTAAIY